jgi:integrase
VPITEITSSMLHDYERYLKKPRKLFRKDRDGNEYTVDSEPLERNGVIRHMMMIRLCFNEAKRKYNNPDTGQIVIAHYPFERYKIQKPTASKHRVISIETFRKIEAAKCLPGSRAEVGRDLFLLSFYLCGMNAVDMLNLPSYKGQDRIEYNRSKTMGKRADKAFISIKVPDEAKPLLKKWAGKLQTLYSNRKTLIRAINEGLEAIGFSEVTFYYARHTFSTWANKQGMSLSQIAKALNHVEQKYKITGIYVEPNWDEVDEVQSAAIRFLGKETDNLIKSVS